MKQMGFRVIQYCHRITAGDAISNHMLELWSVFAENGYESIISARYTDERVKEKKYVVKYEDLELKNTDILMFHTCGIYEEVLDLGKRNCRKILVYHNETPSVFFYDYARPVGYDSGDFYVPYYFPPFLPYVIQRLKKARADIKMTPSLFQRAWTVSHYNALCLEKIGFEHVDVLPIPFKRSGVDITPTKGILEKYSSTINIIFVGRIVANKKQNDIIKAFSYYHRIEPRSQLFLIGNFELSDDYQDKYMEYASSLGLGDCVHMPGKVSDEDLKAYWQSASLFLSMSEHEGFCVPILEAFANGVPVMAYASSAVTETVGNAGVLFYEKNFPLVAETMNSIITDKKRVDAMKMLGYERIKEYDPAKLAGRAVELLLKVVNEESPQPPSE